MRITTRQSAILMLSLFVVIATLLVVSQALAGAHPNLLAATAAAALLQGGVLIAYLRGWDGALAVAVGMVTLLVAALLPEPYLSGQFAPSILIPPVLALILTRPRWVVASAGAVLLGLLWRAGWTGIYTDPSTIIVFCAVVGGMILARVVTDTAHRAAEENACRAEEERARAEQRAAELDEATQLLEEEVKQQRTLLTLVETLETPVVRLAEGVLFAPVVGRLDSRRADALMKRLLDAVHTQRAGTMILDIAGVPVVDTGVAGALVRTVQGLRMLGCEVVVSGISAPVASSLVQLGAPLGGIRTVRSPEEALALAEPTHT